MRLFFLFLILSGVGHFVYYGYWRASHESESLAPPVPKEVLSRPLALEWEQVMPRAGRGVVKKKRPQEKKQKRKPTPTSVYEINDLKKWKGHFPLPSYPVQSLRRSESGVVLIKIMIDELGQVVSSTVEKSSGHVRLDEEARRRVLEWRFQQMHERQLSFRFRFEIDD